jgi:hypothetical protein
MRTFISVRGPSEEQWPSSHAGRCVSYSGSIEDAKEWVEIGGGTEIGVVPRDEVAFVELDESAGGFTRLETCIATIPPYRFELIPGRAS